MQTQRQHVTLFFYLPRATYLSQAVDSVLQIHRIHLACLQIYSVPYNN